MFNYVISWFNTICTLIWDVVEMAFIGSEKDWMRAFLCIINTYIVYLLTLFAAKLNKSVF